MSEAPGVRGEPIDVTALYINSSIVAPLSGGLNQRERRNSDNFERTSALIVRQHAGSASLPR